MVQKDVLIPIWNIRGCGTLPSSVPAAICDPLFDWLNELPRVVNSGSSPL
jgi:hypothetical protein